MKKALANNKDKTLLSIYNEILKYIVNYLSDMKYNISEKMNMATHLSQKLNIDLSAKSADGYSENIHLSKR